MTAISLWGALVIAGGTVHTGDGPPLERASVVIAGGQITAVGDLRPPADAQVIDATGKVVTAGLIECQSKLGLVEIDLVAGTRDDDARGADPIRSAFRGADAFNPYSTVIPVQRAHGITTTIAAPTGGLIAGRAFAFDLGAQTPFMPEAAMMLHLGADRAGSRATRFTMLREVLLDARLWRKNRSAFDRNQVRRLVTSRADLQALIPVLDRRMPLVVHVHRRADIRAIIELARAEKLKIIIAGGTEAWMEAPRLAEAQIPVILNPLQNLPRNFDRLHARADAATVLAAVGAPVIISTFDTHMARTLRIVAGNAVREGLAPELALRAITVHPAQAFGITDRGRLAAGQVANVVVWSGDPFELSTRAEHVIVGGQVQSPDHRQHRLLERYRTPRAPTR